MDYFKQMEQSTGVLLNNIQKQAVLKTEGPLLLLASPGSGKTTTLNMKIGYLLLEKKVKPDSIMAVTFSRAAAEDMAARFQQFFHDKVNRPVQFSTIHSFAYRIVKAYFHKKNVNYRLIEGDVEPHWLHKRMALQQLFTTKTGKKITEDELESLITYISYVKNRMIQQDQLQQVKCSLKEAKDIYIAYEEWKRNYDDQTLLLDFDDMLTYAYEALLHDKMILQKLQKQYDYVLTDESQDNSLVQHKIVEKIASPQDNLCVVADDDQSIFQWRGSDVGHLLEFKSRYPDGEVLTMTENYRSSKTIVQVANTFIKRNKERYRKEMYTANDTGIPIQVQNFKKREAKVRYVMDAVKEQENRNEVAILYRNNNSAVSVVNAMDRLDMDFYMKEIDTKFFRHWVTTDILNFMRFSYHTGRVDVLEQIYSKFNAYMKKDQMKWLVQEGKGECAFARLQNTKLEAYQVSKLKQAKRAFDKINKLSPSAAITVIEDDLGYRKALEQRCERLGLNVDRAKEILDALKEIAEDEQTLKGFAERLKRLEAKMKQSKFNKGQNAPTLSTFHRAKGLEFDRVYMIDLNRDILPTKEDNDDPKLMEEAVRLFYVGMTRARVNLELLSSGGVQKESPFLPQIKKLIAPSTVTNSHRAGTTVAHEDLLPNATIEHEKFGIGTIVDVKSDTMTVDFEHHGEKEFIKKFCVERGLLTKV
ncbi:hypothetical protein DH09_16205 [Bacillaceae bacterium JMAK1]|nr:hypothetical protein DH09_16205 [Bacillaceae bacterium JMAK1]